jgi:glycosyltransferase involved in cell wall biosynthesis
MEVIVVNDGSTDDTAAMLVDYASRTVCLEQQNRGVSAARNTGMRAARGEFVAFLDGDDTWLPEKTTEQLAVFARSPSIGLVSCPYFLMDEDGVTRARHQGGPAAGGTALSAMVLRNTVGSASSVMLRRECLERVGTFDEGLVNSSEDWDYYLRVVLASYEIAFTDRPLVKYRLVSSSLSSAKNVDRMLRNDLMVLGKVFADPRFCDLWRLRRQAHSARHLSAAWHYVIDGGDESLPQLRLAVKRAFLSYPPAFRDRSHLMVVLHALLGGERFGRIKTALRRFARR